MNQNQDIHHLRLLSIFHYILGVIVGLFSLFPLIHLTIGLAIVTGAIGNAESNPPPQFLGWFFVLISIVFIASGLTMAICIVVAGRKIKKRTGHLFCLVIAGIECCFAPFGTVLGVLTILVLCRPTVKQLFGVNGEPTLQSVAGSSNVEG